jgi:GNAT superfamily N-acetyltransferase
MFVNRDFRGQGYAPVILVKLKEWCYQHNLKPIAGCWYPNTLSRKSLEAAGMIAISIGYEAILMGKEKLPLRTGNPPGEQVKEKNE